MTSSGSLLPFAVASAFAGRMVLSGPVAGWWPLGMGPGQGYQSIISFDMGGTSTDVCRVAALHPDDASQWGGKGESFPLGPGADHWRRWRESGVGRRRRCAAGGTGIGRCRSRPGRIRPRWRGGHGDRRQCGARPHPGRSHSGRNGESRRPGGPACSARARAADLGLEIEDVAAGVIEVVDTHMERALRAVSVEDGSRSPSLGPRRLRKAAWDLYATRLARRLGVLARPWIPHLSGVFSASLPLLLANPSSDALMTVMLGQGSRTGSSAVAGRIAADAHPDIRPGPRDTLRVSLDAWADVRYVGQSHELAVPLATDLESAATGLRGCAPGSFWLYPGRGADRVGECPGRGDRPGADDLG